MKRTSPIFLAGWSAAALLAAALLLPAPAEGVQPAYQASAATAAVHHLLLPVPFPMSPAAMPPAALGTLPTSVFPHTDHLCSVQALQMPEQCSVFQNSPGRKCSAYCDEGMICSALSGDNSPDVAFCSTSGRIRGLCSVLPPARNQTGPSMCSAFNDSPFADQINCSVLQPGGPKQACSALNPSQQRNDCSAFRAQGPIANCSVLTAGQQFRKFCSVGRPGPKTCSTYGDFTQCSAGPNSRGVCTALRGAPTTACSVQNGNGHCSVFGGASGSLCAP